MRSTVAKEPGERRRERAADLSAGEVAATTRPTPTPLLDPDGPGRARRLRIARGLALEVGCFIILTVLLPALLVGAALLDATLWLARGKPWMSVRMLVIVWCVLLGEVRGLLGLARVSILAGGPWAKDTPTRRRRTFDLQVAWASGHLAVVRRLCRLSFEIEGDELLEQGGPIVVLARHASVIDNCVPAALISRAHGFDLRYVLKDGLQAVPSLDIGGRWVPTCFVRRESPDREREIARIRTLAIGLGPRDGVLIFPEGTRFTPEKLAKLRSDATPEQAQRLAGLRHLLPPRPSGALALLEEAPDAAVILCGHVGLDGFHGLGAIWRGGLVGTTVRVRFWRYEGSELPAGGHERTLWLTERWRSLDEWIEEQRSSASLALASTRDQP